MSSMSTLRDDFGVLGKNARAMYCVVLDRLTEKTTFLLRVGAMIRTCGWPRGVA